MSWKKALFFGGAVLLLAACSDATAPTSLNRQRDISAAAKSSPTTPIPTTSTPTTPTTTVLVDTDPLLDLCVNSSGYVVHTGLDGSCPDE
jgi:hypothetical protein